MRGKQILISENLNDFGMDLEDVGQWLKVSAQILAHFPPEYGTFFHSTRVESIYQHYALRLFLIIWTTAETSACLGFAFGFYYYCYYFFFS